MSESSSSKDLNNLLSNQPAPNAPTSKEITSSTNTTPANQSPTNAENTATSPAPTTATSSTTSVIREDMIKPAVSFLSSPNVKSADKSKKIAFLQKKGLNQAEIDEAFKRAGDTETVSPHTTTTTPSTPVSSVPVNRPLAPVLPARNAQPQIIYYPQPPPPPVPAEKVFAMAVVLGMGAIGVTAGIIGLLRRFIGPIFHRIAEYQRTRYNQRKEIGEKLLKSLKSYQNENDDLDAVIDQGDEKTVVEALVKHQAELSSKLDKLVEQSRERILKALDIKTYRNLKLDIDGFKESLSPSDSFGFSHTHYLRNSDSPAVSGLKSDIRSLKAVLLNRRNFPTV